MDVQGREVEVKLRFDSAAVARERLEALGARLLHDRFYEHNVLFDRAREPLHVERKALRLRCVDDRAWLTYKAPVAGDHRHKVRVEEETAVDDPAATERLLAGLGFSPAWRYEKYRTLYELEGVQVCLDETPLGCFVELEGEPDRIDRVAGRLGFGVDEYVRDSYRALHERAEGIRGRRVGDLLFESESGERS